jgi:hypothetical protein
MAVKQPVFDPAVVRELAKCFARAAVDEMLAEQQKQEKTNDEAKSKAESPTVVQ